MNKLALIAFMFSVSALGQVVNPGGGSLPSGVTSPGTGSLTGTGNFQASMLDTGGAVFNVKAYGAKGDGSTNDTTAIGNAITALTSSGAGILYFPQGKYLTSTCNFTLSVPTTVLGTGSATIKQGGTLFTTSGTEIDCAHSSNPLFTVTADTSNFRDISLVNTSGTTPTSGAAIVANSATQAQQAINVTRTFIAGFFDGIDDDTTGSSIIEDNYIFNTVRYAILIDNTLSADSGGWIIKNNTIYQGPLTPNTGTACIHQNAAGGGKIIGNNTVGYAHSYEGNISSSGQLVITDNIFDQARSNVINFTTTVVDDIIIANNHLATSSNANPILIQSIGTFYIGGGYMNTTCSPSCPDYAVKVTGSPSLGVIGPFFSNGVTTGYTNMAGGTSVFDLAEPFFNYSYTASGVTGTAPAFNFNTTTTQPYSINSATGNSMNVGINSDHFASLTLKSTANSLGSYVDFYFNNVDSWLIGPEATQNFLLVDRRNSNSVISLPTNTMPANSISGNASGPILLVMQVPSARKGTFVCTAAGTITISNANEAATSDVIISLNTAGGTITTPPAMKTVTAATGFTVLCGASDTSTYNYDIIN